jgi:hypothetical protein
MTGVHGNVFVHGKEPFKACGKGFFVSSGKICASNAVIEEGIPAEKYAFMFIKECDASRSMPRQVKDLERSDVVSFFKKPVGGRQILPAFFQKRGSPKGGKAPAVNPERVRPQIRRIFPVKGNGFRNSGLPQGGKGGNMVKVPMGE